MSELLDDIFHGDANKFEDVWVKINVHSNYMADCVLSDSEYIDYHIWEEQNWKRLFNKYLPDTTVYRGRNPNIIFHGGCLGCLSQRKHGIKRCTGCQYFRTNWELPDLSIEGEDSDTISGDDLKKFLGGDPEE